MAKQASGETSAEAPSQVVRGTLNLSEIAHLDPDFPIKIILFRDCRILATFLIPKFPDNRIIQYNLAFTRQAARPVGVHFLIGPGDIPDEDLTSFSQGYQTYIPASKFERGGIATLDVTLPDAIYARWPLICRRYTIRGRIVCRRIVWDPKQHKFVLCETPVRGATVTAYDVDRFLWLTRRDVVGSATSDVHGNFEITFTFCCWDFLPGFPDHWVIDPDIYNRIRGMLEQLPFRVPIPRPDPPPDLTFLGQIIRSVPPALGTRAAPLMALSTGTPLINEPSLENLATVGEELVRILPKAPDLETLHIWPWFPAWDCQPDIVFVVTQECGDGRQTIYAENNWQVRWDINTLLSGVTLVANDKACCAPCLCVDPSEDDCLVMQGICGVPIDYIEQNPANPLLGYQYPGTQDSPFGRTLQVNGVFGDAYDVDYYKLQYRRISPAPFGWTDIPDALLGNFYRGHWTGVSNQWEYDVLADICGQKAYRTIRRYRLEHTEVVDAVDPINDQILGMWVTAGFSPSESPLVMDGVYELRVVGYHYDAVNCALIDPRIMPWCPPEGQEVDPTNHATIYLRVDNRAATVVSGSVHINTTEPDCDFPNICAVVKNEGLADEECVAACGILRVKAGDSLTVHFQATDSDGHLGGFELTGHWAESLIFDLLNPAIGTLAGDPTELFGPTYAATFGGAQGPYRTGLPAGDPERDRPGWFGGHYKVTVTVGDNAFETCCAYLLRLHVWKRTTNGCGSPENFHDNHCEFSFTVFRSDLINNPDHPSCSDLCPDQDVIP